MLDDAFKATRAVYFDWRAINENFVSTKLGAKLFQNNVGILKTIFICDDGFYYNIFALSESRENDFK